MPLWDSVHRSLEKASQEAGRIAKVQRLRSTIDGFSRQMSSQSNSLVNKAMELFNAGQLSQAELLPFCQELETLHQQLQQVQNELKQLQTSQPASPGAYLQADIYAPPPPESGLYTSGSEDLTYAPPPPEYQSYMELTGTVPPPPPGVETLTVSSVETAFISGNALSSGAAAPPQQRLCPNCSAEVSPMHAFCQNCGTPVGEVASQHLPTIRATMNEAGAPGEQVRAQPKAVEQTATSDETIRAEYPASLSGSPSPSAEEKKEV